MNDSSTWRDLYPIHPCADAFPMLSDDELDSLAADMKAVGLREPIVFWHDGGTRWVLDGRNRLEALVRAGIEITDSCFREITPDAGFDPARYVISENIRRRHLTKEQQAESIVKAIAAGMVDRAKVARSFNPTSGKKGGSTKDPLLAAVVAEGEKQDLSKRTMQRGVAKVFGRKPKSTIEPTVTLPPPPPSTYEWVDNQLTELRQQQVGILARYATLAVEAPKLSAAERRTVRNRLVEVRRCIDRAIKDFGGTHKPEPELEPVAARRTASVQVPRRVVQAPEATSMTLSNGGSACTA